MPQPVVATHTGKVRGFERPESCAFLGIPFAAPPVGDLRFAAPRPHPPWSEVRDADRYGPTPQRRPFGPVVTIPEPSIPGDSTLNVNVFTPVPGDRQARLPVLVWIHGGGFFAGSPASPWYDGASFNRDGVVTVTISYRLGFDGFGWIEDAPANRGILDQVAALRWVQDNIDGFGGDPDRVTIAGQSAGGGSVLALLAAPGVQGLFRAAIAQSGVARHRTLDDATGMGRRFAGMMGVSPTRSGWAALSEEEILDGQADLYAGTGHEDAPVARAIGLVRELVSGDIAGWLPFVPHVDGDLLPTGTIAAVMSGVGADKPLLMGANAHEFTMATASVRDTLLGSDSEDLLLSAGLPGDVATTLRRAFPGFDSASLLGQVMTEYMFRVPLQHVIDARLAAPSGAATWLYDFRWPSPVSGLAAHCHELPFMWDLLDADGVVPVLGDSPPRELAEAMHSAWVTFVRDWNPGWRSISPGSRPGMVFSSRSRVEADPFSLAVEFGGIST